MGWDEADRCPGASKGVQSHGSLSVDIPLVCLLLPFGTWFAQKFWRELNALPLDSTQRTSKLTLKVLIIAGTTMLWCAVLHWASMLLRLLKVNGSFGLKHCAVSSAIINLTYACACACNQRILLQRLQLVFANSTHTVSGRVVLAFDFSLTLVLVLVTASVIYGWTKPCRVNVDFYEFSGHSPTCRFQDAGARVALLLYIAFVMCGNLLLVWMYLWRLKAVFVEANYRQETGERLTAATRDTTSEQRSMIVWRALDVMRKSTVIAIWTVASSLFVMATWSIPVRNSGILIDVVVNEVLFYCLVTEDGDDWYDALFRSCHFTVDCCLPKRALNIEHDIEQEFNSSTDDETLKSGVAGVVVEEHTENETLNPGVVEEKTET